MSAPVLLPHGPQQWTCDDCGRRFAWHSGAYWYGSWREVDEGDWSKVSTYCGCRPMPAEIEGEV